MGFFDTLNDMANNQIKRNLDYLRQKARSSSDDGLRNWWSMHQYDDGDYAERAKEIVKNEMDRRGMYY